MTGKQIRKTTGWIAVILAAGSLALSYWGFGDGFTKANRIKVTQAIILAGWIVLPPVWFWLEYFRLYLPNPNSFEDWEKYKYGQDLASKIWLALVTTLFGLYFGKDLIRGG